MFINSLKDNRTIWLNGENIDITTNEHFKGTLETISHLYKMFDDSNQQSKIGYLNDDKQWVHSAFLIPHSYDELIKRKIAFETWARATDGIMSRLPDYARSRLTGWFANRDSYCQYDSSFPEKLAAYYEQARDEHRFISIVQRDPQINRSDREKKNTDELGLLTITKKTKDGVYVNGAKMIGTAAPYSHDLIIYPLSKLEDKTKQLAHMLIVPADSPGLHMVCREPFAISEKESADHPLSAKFDEMDAVLIFDEVFIPWERVLLHDNPNGLAQIKADPISSGLAYHQAIIRLLARLEFSTAIANEIAEVIGASDYLHVQEKLGELIMQIETIRALIIAAEREGRFNGKVYVPNFNYIQTARTLGSKYYPRSLEILQLIGAGGFIQLPSSIKDFSSPLKDLMNKYYKGKNTNAEKRTKLFKLAWDLIGSPLGSRHELYERFYAGDPMLHTANQFHQYDKTKFKKMISPYLENN